MRVLVIVGSRNPTGQTGSAAEALAQGARERGVEVELRLLPLLRVERCRQCDDDGWGQCRREGSCVIPDDLGSLTEDIRRSDALVVATPVYFGDLSESTRAFLDRLRRVTRQEAAKNGIVGKKAIGICVAGGGGGGAPNCSVSLERALGSTGFNVVNMIPARRQNLAHKLAVLKSTGAWLAGELA